MIPVLVVQQYLPDHLAGKVYYTPTDQGYEAEIKRRMQRWAARKQGRTCQGKIIIKTVLKMACTMYNQTLSKFP